MINFFLILLSLKFRSILNANEKGKSIIFMDDLDLFLKVEIYFCYSLTTPRSTSLRFKFFSLDCCDFRKDSLTTTKNNEQQCLGTPKAGWGNCWTVVLNLTFSRCLVNQGDSKLM